MTKVVQFMHQGGEVDPRRLAMYNGWNATNNHGRRLLRHWGEYVNAQNQIVSDDLAFWNEYEAPTKATPIGGVNRGFNYATYYHEILLPVPPLLSQIKSASCCVNTDPCVFGDTFKYSNCQQVPNGDLWNLPIGSIILFGAHKNNLFALDTVFVVGVDGVQYNVPIGNNPPRFKASKEYNDVTLNNLVPRANNRGRTMPMIDRFMFYRGKAPKRIVGDRIDENVIFSFTPARIFGSQNYNERCLIDLSQINVRLANKGIKAMFSRGLLQGHLSVLINGSINAVSAIWNEVRLQVQKNGFILGTHFDWPIAVNDDVANI